MEKTSVEFTGGIQTFRLQIETRRNKHLVQWVINNSGGLAKNQKQAVGVLIGFTLLLVFSVFLIAAK